MTFEYGLVGLLGFLIGIVSAMFGIGGGFFFTPFFHAYIGLPAEVAVATSASQIPFIGLSGSFKYARSKQIDYKKAFILLIPVIFSAQATAWTLGSFSESMTGKMIVFGKMTVTDLTVMVIFTIGIGSLAIFGLTQKNFERSETLQPQDAGFPWLPLVYTGLVLGFLSAFIGIGGGFVAVPFFIYFLHMDTRKAVATSLFVVFVNGIFTTSNYAIQGLIHYDYMLYVGLGGLIGAQIGAALTLKLESESIRKSFSIFQLIVVAGYIIYKVVK